MNNNNNNNQMLYFTKTMFCPSKLENGNYSEKNIHTFSADETNAFLDTMVSNADPLFEWIEPNTNIKPYFDIDFKTKNEGEYENLKDDILNQCVSAILENIDGVVETDLNICSYNGKDLSKHSPHYGEHCVSYHIVISNFFTTKYRNRAIAKELKNKVKYFDNGVYKTNQLLRVSGHHKYEYREKGNRSPKFIWKSDRHPDAGYQSAGSAMKFINGTPILEYRYKYLINNVGNINKMTDLKLKNNIGMEISKTVDETPNINKELWHILCDLPSADCDEREKWWFITKLIKSTNKPKNQTTWDKWSMISANYNHDKNFQMWDDITDIVPNAMSILRKKSEKKKPLPEPIDVDEDEMRTLRKIHHAFKDGSDEATVALFIDLYKNYFKVVDYKHNLIYLFDDADCLWKKISKDFLNSFITKHFAPLRQRYLEVLVSNPDSFQKTSDDEHKAILKSLSNSKMSKTKNNYKIEFFTHDDIQDINFERKLNSNKDVLSVKNGLVCLKTGKLRERKYSDHISKCLAIDYNENARKNPNYHFLKFIYDIFDAKELNALEIVKYVQVWLGYCITQHNDAQKCNILFGKGSNGKGVLNDVLTTILKCDTGKMTDSWGSSLFDDSSSKKESSNQASPELANLEGCNIGLVNETSEGLLFGEMFKKLVDNTKSLNCRQLHQESKSLELITKFMISTNDFPMFPTDTAYTRRIDVLPMLCKFTDNPDKDNKNEKVKDRKLFAKMCEGTDSFQKKQYILRWLVEGSMEFYLNGGELLPSPPCCEKYKIQHIKNNDWLSFFEFTDNKKDFMSYEDIWNEINERIKRRDLSKAKIGLKLEEKGAKSCRVTRHGKKVRGFSYIKSNQDFIELDISEFGKDVMSSGSDSDSDSE
jgi:phage/plasmid-associated DNA primase